MMMIIIQTCELLLAQLLESVALTKEELAFKLMQGTTLFMPGNAVAVGDRPNEAT